MVAVREQRRPGQLEMPADLRALAAWVVAVQAVGCRQHRRTSQEAPAAAPWAITERFLAGLLEAAAEQCQPVRRGILVAVEVAADQTRPAMAATVARGSVAVAVAVAVQPLVATVATVATGSAWSQLFFAKA